MTIQRTRSLLGEKVKHLSDMEVQGLIIEYSSFAEVLLALAVKAVREENSVRSMEGGKNVATTSSDLRASKQ